MSVKADAKTNTDQNCSFDAVIIYNCTASLILTEFHPALFRACSEEPKRRTIFNLRAEEQQKAKIRRDLI
jgi:hypothetical protein